MSLEDEWGYPLFRRVGGPTRLCGIDVFHEFAWTDVFADNRSQFPNGQRLAERICEDCPDGMEPTLLLTVRSDEPEQAHEIDGRYVVVVNARRYLEQANADAAVSYFAGHLKAISRASEQSHLADASAAEIQQFLAVHLDPEALRAWVEDDESRLDVVREAFGSPALTDASSLADALRALESIQDLDGELLEALLELCGREADRGSRLRILRALTQDSGGRRDTGEVLGQRAADRLADARAAVEEYTELLEAGAGETRLQECIEADPWLLGLEYTAIRPRVELPRGAMDFLAERFDGVHDLLELKSPQDAIISVRAGRDEAPASASNHSLSRPLANALAQIHIYRATLTTGSELMEEQYGLHQTKDPRAMVVIGRASQLTDFETGILRELNKSLHRVEIVPFDLIGQRASVILDNVERYLGATDSDAGSSA
jgi:hypothetical protein